MRIALISDLHGNMTAVRALEEDLKKRVPDEVWCLGDLVGKGPNSDQSFDWVMEHCQAIIGGNWDYGIGRKEFPRDSFYHRQLGEERLEKLSMLPLEKQLNMSGRKIRLIHGRPVMPRLLNIQDSREAFMELLEPDYNILMYGDCHRQGARTLGGQIINIGSVGNGLGVPMVQYLILEGDPGEKPATMNLCFITLPYDNRAAEAEARKQAELPDLEAYITEVLTGVYAGHQRVRTDVFIK
jgi:predicted phosphodiesterase